MFRDNSCFLFYEYARESSCVIVLEAQVVHFSILVEKKIGSNFSLHQRLYRVDPTPSTLSVLLAVVSSLEFLNCHIGSHR